MKPDSLIKMSEPFGGTGKMPVLFLGHESPMNAIEDNEKMKKFIMGGDHESLINYQSQGRAFQLAIPTPEHFLPLLYALALKEGDDSLTFFNDKAVAGSLTMTSLKIGTH